MQWTKAPQELVDAFDAAMAGFPVAERRKMFGYPAAFANGNMFAGVHQSSFVLRLPEEERAEFLRIPGAGAFEPMPGRPMREYVVVPPDMLGRPAELSTWIERSLAYASSLQPKAKKPRRRSHG